MSETLADELKRLCCAESEGKFFDCVTDNIDAILSALRSHDALVNALEVIRDSFWRDGETCDERIGDLKQIARAALAPVGTSRGPHE